MLGRRHLLELSVAGVAALTCTPSTILPGDAVDPLDAWLPLINASLAATRVGARLAQDHSEQVLRVVLNDARTHLAAADRVSAFTLRQVIADDFRQDRVITAGTVLLSMTEAALYLRLFVRIASGE